MVLLQEVRHEELSSIHFQAKSAWCAFPIFKANLCICESFKVPS